MAFSISAQVYDKEILVSGLSPCMQEDSRGTQATHIASISWLSIPR